MNRGDIAAGMIITSIAILISMAFAFPQTLVGRFVLTFILMFADDLVPQ